MNSEKKMTIQNAWICQISADTVIPRFGDLQISDGIIQRIIDRDFGTYQHKHEDASGTQLDAGGRVLTVPMVNFHDHIYSRLAKGLSSGGSMENFMEILQNFWWKLDAILDEDMVKACAYLTAIDSIRNGVTYIFDHHASPGFVSGSLDSITEILSKYGLRGTLCFETSDRYGAEAVEKVLEENTVFMDHHRNSSFKGMFGLHAAFTLSDQTLHKIAVLLRRRDAGIHIHLAEARHDQEYCQRQFGCSAATRLQKFGLLNPKSIAAHGVHLTEADYKILQESGTALVYNPDSNLNNAVGLPDFQKVPPAIPILAGTDGMHSNISRTVKQLFLLYRSKGASFNQAFTWLMKIHSDQLKFVKRYFPDFPSLTEGSRADFIIRDYVPPTPFTTGNYWGHYVYGMLEAPVHSVVQNGNALMMNGQFTFSTEHIYEEARRQGERLAEKFR